MSEQIIRIEGIKWWIQGSRSARIPVPLCPDHNLRMTPVPVEINSYSSGTTYNARRLECAEGPHFFELGRRFDEQKIYVLNRIDAKVFEKMEVVDLDGELTPIAKEKINSKNNKYFIMAQLMESKRGIQLVVYAGEKGKPDKTQIFIEPEIKRLAFDQRNLNPNDIFLELKATFNDGSSHTITKSEKDNEKQRI